MNTSNFARLKELLRRAAAGQELTLGFLGGSITQGSLSTQPGNAYAFRVYQWFVDTFPQSKFHYVNGGIGGTDSLYGVARAVTDVLMYQPDFVVVDFSVNDLEVHDRVFDSWCHSLGYCRGYRNCCSCRWFLCRVLRQDLSG